MNFKQYTTILLIAFCLLFVGDVQPAQAQSSVDWSGWTFDYAVSGNYDGLSLSNVTFNGTEILQKASFPVMRVFYDNNACGPYADRLGGSLSPVEWANNVTIVDREIMIEGERWREIGIQDTIGAYVMYQVWYLSENGVIDGHIFAKGLQCNVTHLHLPYWRMDFDLAGSGNDQVRRYTNSAWETMTTEFTAAADSALGHQWQIRDTVTGDQVDVEFGTNIWNVPGTIIPETSYGNNNVHVRRYQSSEDGGWTYGANSDVPFDNNENIDSQDIVFWYDGDMRHTAAEGPTLWHSTGVRFVVNLNDGPTPTPTNTAPPPTPTNTPLPGTNTALVNADFDSGTSGFSYQDNTFRSTNQGTYASGTRVTSGAYNGSAGLQVLLGGINNNDILNMSGGWTVNFNVPSTAPVNLAFRYNLTQSSEYESDEYGQVLAAVDGVLFGANGNDYIQQLAGDGNGGASRSTGWQTYSVDLGTLSAGNHTLVIGGFSNKKTYGDEVTTILIDDVEINADISQIPTPTFTPTNTPLPTATPTAVAPTATAVAPTATAVAPTATAVAPTATAVAPTATAVAPTATAVAPTATAVAPTATAVAPTATAAAPTATAAAPTATAVAPTATAVAPTATAVAPTATAVAPTATPIPNNPPVTGLMLYDDSLATGWRVGNWGGVAYQLNNNNGPYAGTNTLSVQYNEEWGTLYFMSDQPVTASDYDQLSFWVKSGDNTSTTLRISIMNSSFATSSRVTISNIGSTWQLVTIPLSDFGSLTNILYLLWDNPQSASSSIYLDNVILASSSGSTATSTPTTVPQATATNTPISLPPTATSTPASLPPTATSTPTAPAGPVNGLSIYDDSLATGWSKGTWGDVTNSISSTSPVYSGSASIKLQYNGAWGTYYFLSNQLLDPGDYTNLSFWVYGNTDGNSTLSVSVMNSEYQTSYKATLQNLGAGWRYIQIPLTELGSLTDILYILLDNPNASGQPAIYIDDFILEDANAAEQVAAASFPFDIVTRSSAPAPIINGRQTRPLVESVDDTESESNLLQEKSLFLPFLVE